MNTMWLRGLFTNARRASNDRQRVVRAVRATAPQAPHPVRTSVSIGTYIAYLQAQHHITTSAVQRKCIPDDVHVERLPVQFLGSSEASPAGAKHYNTRLVAADDLEPFACLHSRVISRREGHNTRGGGHGPCPHGHGRCTDTGDNNRTRGNATRVRKRGTRHTKDCCCHGGQASLAGGKKQTVGSRSQSVHTVNCAATLHVLRVRGEVMCFLLLHHGTFGVQLRARCDLARRAVRWSWTWRRAAVRARGHTSLCSSHEVPTYRIASSCKSVCAVPVRRVPRCAQPQHGRQGGDKGRDT